MIINVKVFLFNYYIMIELLNQEYAIALFILYLILSGNYIGDLFGCRLQEAFTEIVFFKHIIAFLSLYYFVNLSTHIIQDPIKVLIKSMIMYLVFIFSRNVAFGYTIIFLLSMIVIKFLEDYKEYHYQNDKNDKKENNLFLSEDRINLIQKILVIVIYISIVVGFVRYAHNTFKSHKNFKWLIFLFGENRSEGCKSLNDNATLKNIQWF